MEARLTQVVRAAIALMTLTAAAASCPAARHRTTNFDVYAPTPQLAREIGERAEHFRRALAIDWLGQELPPWSKACPIRARVAAQLGAGGATSFVFDRGEVFGWKMNIQGSRERILDSVLPHEVTHTIFATYFRQPLPRWADEGACTTVEHPSEIAKQERMLIEFLKTGRGIAFSQMFAMKEYPRDVMPLYSQGHSLAQLLIESRGKKAFLDFLSDGLQDENWPRAVRQHYGYENLFALQTTWLDWVRQGRPPVGTRTAPGTQLATHATPPGKVGPLIRAQSPDRVAAPPAAAPAAAPAQVLPGNSIYATMAARSRPAQSTQARPPQARPAQARPTQAIQARPTQAGPPQPRPPQMAPPSYDASLRRNILRR